MGLREVILIRPSWKRSEFDSTNILETSANSQPRMLTFFLLFRRAILYWLFWARSNRRTCEGLSKQKPTARRGRAAQLPIARNIVIKFAAIESARCSVEDKQHGGKRSDSQILEK